jgi:mannose/fructose/N-acetylgalactosamine-specific phosphotransferase system component IID
MPQASQSSPYRRAQSDVWLAILPALKKVFKVKESDVKTKMII